jgi:histone H3/H4
MESPQNKDKKARASYSSKAQILFPVSRVLKKMKQTGYAKRVSVKASVCLTTALEYLVNELIELSGDLCFSEDGTQIESKIKPEHISNCIRNDPELYKAVGSHILIPFGGYLPLHND